MSIILALIVSVLSTLNIILLSSSTRIDGLQSLFSDTKALIPENQYQDIIKVQNGLVSILEHASYYVSSAKVAFPYHKVHRSYARYESTDSESLGGIDEKFKSKYSEGLSIRVDVDVVFLGFPNSAVNVIRDNWFDNLDRSDPLLASLGPFHDLKEHIGGSHFDYHFHLVQVSFQVIDSIKNRMKHIIKKFNTTSISAWEMDEVLDGLSKVITSTHETASHSKLIIPASTVFILNTELSQEFGVKFLGDFDASLLNLAAKDAKIVELCQKIVNEPKRRSKLMETASAAKVKRFPVVLSDIRKKNEAVAKRLEDNDRKRKNGLEEEVLDATSSSKDIHWRDAVQETKQWSVELDKVTTSLFTLSDDPTARITRVLLAPKNSFLSRHTLPLASKILSLASSFADNMDDITSDATCFATIHASQGRFVWTDITAHTPFRPFHRSAGGASPAPMPKLVDKNEWLSIGDESNVDRDINAHILALKLIMSRHLKVAKHQYDNSDCAKSMYLLDSFYRAPNISHAEHLQTILEYIMNEYHYGYTQSDCSALLFEMSFLNVTIESVNDIIELEANSNVDSKLRDPYFGNMLKSVLLKSLIQAVDLIGMYVDSTSYRENDIHVSTSAAHKILNDEVVTYLSYISSNVLKVVRHFVSPPIRLTIPQDLKHNIRDYSQSATSQALFTNPISKILDEISSPSMHFHRKGLNKEGKWGLFGRFAKEVSVGDNSESLFHSIQSGLFNSYKSYLNSNRKGNAISSYVFGSFEGQSVESMCNDDDALKLLSSSEDENILYWASLKPFAVIPRKIDVAVYVIRTHKSYYPLSDYVGSSDGFDHWTFITELMRLKLETQDMSVSINILDAFSEEPNLAISLDRCYMSEYVHQSYDYYYSNNIIDKREYMDGACILSHIKKFDTTIERDSRHIPVYLLSFDSKSPILLNNQEQSILVDESVIVTQNYQQLIRSGICCGDTTASLTISNTNTKTNVNEVYSNGRNPVAAALRAMASAIAGVSNAHQGHKGQETSSQTLSTIIDFDSVLRRRHGDTDLSQISKSAFCSNKKNVFDDLKASRNKIVESIQLWDWSSFTGSSPRFLSSQSEMPRFSDLDLNLIFRSQVLRGLSLAQSILSFELHSIVDKLLYYKENNDISRSQELVMDSKIVAYVSRVDSLIKNAINSLSSESWDNAAHYSNAAIDAATHPQDYIHFDESQFEFVYRSYSSGEGTEDRTDYIKKEEDHISESDGGENLNVDNSNGNSIDVNNIVFSSTFVWISVFFLFSIVVLMIIYYLKSPNPRETKRPVSFRNSI